MTFIEITDEQLISWKENADGIGMAVFKAQHPEIPEFKGQGSRGIVYNERRYKVTKLTIDFRTVTFQRIIEKPRPAPPPAPDLPQTDPETLARADDPETSKEAAITLKEDSGNLRVSTILYETGKELTCDEIEDGYVEKGWYNHDGEPHKRIDTLRKAGWVEETGEFRKSKQTGRRMTVYRLTEKGRAGVEKYYRENS